VKIEKGKTSVLRERLGGQIKTHRERLESADPVETLVLCLDNSGSMQDRVAGGGARRKIDVLKDSTVALVAEVDPTLTHVGLVVFGRVSSSLWEGDFEAGEPTPPSSYGAVTLVPPTDRPGVVRDRAAWMQGQGNTPMDEGILMALAALEGTPGRHRMLLFSDGAATCSMEDVIKAVEAAITRKVIIDTVGVSSFGGEHYLRLLMEIAKRTGGIFKKVDDILSLPGMFRQLETRQRRLLE
jgi:Mg-chelatase subunit ChlD